MDVETETAFVAMLSASFALVKPAGITPKETKDWLRVALDSLQHIPLHIFEPGCRAARLTCTHHSQIVPAIVAETRDALAWHNRPKRAPVLRLVDASPNPNAGQPLPDPATMTPSLRRLGLSAGFLVDRGGHVEWDEGSAA